MDDQELSQKILDVLRKNRGTTVSYSKVANAVNVPDEDNDLKIHETLKSLRYQGKIGYNLSNMGYFLYDE